jgi:hypothetical protein
MKAELTTGEIVTLAKECDCPHHNEPHWVHVDATWRKRNDETLRATPFARRYFAMGVHHKEEQIRIARKQFEMKHRGIVRLIREPSDEMTPEQQARVEQDFAHLVHSTSAEKMDMGERA